MFASSNGYRAALSLNSGRLCIGRRCARSLALMLFLVSWCLSIQVGQASPPSGSANDAARAGGSATGTLVLRFEYDGAPPAPRELQPQGPRVHTREGDKTVGPPKESDVRLFAKNKIVDESLVVGKDRGIANVFVWVRSKDIPFPTPAALTPVTIAFRHGHIEPHAIAFQAPRLLVLQNDEDVACNFNLGETLAFNKVFAAHTQGSFDVRPQTLGIPGRVTGNIQQWLSAYVFSLAHPFCAVSDEHGDARIKDLPPGKWEFQVWHERCGWVKTTSWRMGRFTLAIKNGDNDLGTIKLAPDVFGAKADVQPAERK